VSSDTRHDTPVAVASRSFSRDARLRAALIQVYPRVRFNETGHTLVGAALVDFLRGHPKAITGLETLDERLFCAVPELRVVSKYGVGLDMIDVDAARSHGVRVWWTPGVNRQAVAELTVCLMIALCRRVVPLALDVRERRWHQPVGRQLSSAVVGILGCGHVGQQVTRLCRAFGADVLAHDIRAYDEFYRETGVRPVTRDVLLAESDILTIHVPLDASTRGMIGAQEIARMKASAFLLNTARGGIVDEAALKRALVDGRLAGAACDVFAEEPPADPGLLALPTFLATPHIGGSTQESVLAMGRAAIAGLDGLDGAVDLTALA
jgi:phosphoglycerate dehydrogenase-like enzyme